MFDISSKMGLHPYRSKKMRFWPTNQGMRKTWTLSELAQAGADLSLRDAHSGVTPLHLMAAEATRLAPKNRRRMAASQHVMISA
jgi:hypothetical protein